MTNDSMCCPYCSSFTIAQFHAHDKQLFPPKSVMCITCGSIFSSDEAKTIAEEHLVLSSLNKEQMEEEMLKLHPSMTLFELRNIHD